MRRSAIALSLLLSPLAAGCDSTPPLEPVDVAAVYALESVNGQPLPAEILDNGTFSYSVLLERLTLESDGTGIQESVHRTDYADPTKPDVRHDSLLELTFRVRGDRVEVSFPCAPNALCTEGPHLVGRVDGDALVVDHLSGHELRYHRVAP